jgi:hypothetical protein
MAVPYARLIRGLTALACLAAAAPGAAWPGSVARSDVGVRRDSSSHTERPIAAAQAGELDRFLEAKRLVFDQQWAAVRDGMERYLRDYPAGRMRDEALYWLARSLDALARKERDVARVVALERSAMDRIDRLTGDFPRSSWCEDATALRVQIAGLLVLLGESQYQSVIVDTLADRGRESASLSPARSAALDAAISLAPDVSFVLLIRVLRTDDDPAIRKKAAVLLARTFLDKATATLNEVARGDRDAEVRDLARDVLSRITSALAPVSLAYSCLDGRVIDRTIDATIPEGRITTVVARPAGTAGAEGARRAVELVFGGRIALSSNRAEVADSGDPFESPAMTQILARSATTKHMMGSFVVGVVPGSVRKTGDRAAGRAQFDSMVASFEVGPGSDVVLAVRRGDRVALMSFRLVPRPAALPAREGSAHRTAAGESGTLARDRAAAPVYCGVFHLGDGLVVRSTRCSWPGDAPNIVDFGRSAAEIPGAGGKWTLAGDISIAKSSRLLIARGATLVRPDGRLAADAEEIRVPLGDPAAFTASGATKK